MNVNELLKAIGNKFVDQKPTKTRLSRFIATFGIAEGLALASLILAYWAWLYPRDPERSARCPLRRPLTGSACGAKLVHTEFNESAKKLTLVCERGHKTQIKTN
jgi:hypothetical protein